MFAKITYIEFHWRERIFLLLSYYFFFYFCVFVVVTLSAKFFISIFYVRLLLTSFFFSLVLSISFTHQEMRQRTVKLIVSVFVCDFFFYLFLSTDLKVFFFSFVLVVLFLMKIKWRRRRRIDVCGWSWNEEFYVMKEKNKFIILQGEFLVRAVEMKEFFVILDKTFAIFAQPFFWRVSFV